MQGTDGPLGGPDVRRRIPIKLLPKQTRNKPAPRPQRPAGRLLPKAHSEEGIVYIFSMTHFSTFYQAYYQILRCTTNGACFC